MSSTLKSLFPNWITMWQGYSQNYMESYYVKTLGQKSIHILLLHSVYKKYQNWEFEDDEESAVDGIMTMIRAKAMRLSQNQLFYQNVYEKLKLPVGDYKQLTEIIHADVAPYYRKDTTDPHQNSKVTDIQHQGLQYPTHSNEKFTRQRQINLSEGKRAVNQTKNLRQFPIDRNWIARMSGSFSEAGLFLDDMVDDFRVFFLSVYPFEGNYILDENTGEYRWKSRRSTEELETDEETGRPIDDEEIRDISKEEYEQMKADGKDVKKTWYLEGTYRKLAREKKELKKLSSTSKQKKEQQIEALEKLIKIYEKEDENPSIDFFIDTLDEMGGFEDYKNIITNYFVNLLNPTDVPTRPLSFILAGHPGTGKSAIAGKTAKASKRAFIQIPMNGQNEPTYLKGREIAYGGAEQGKILKEILSKGSSRPIILIDELTRAGSKALTDIIGTMTDPDQNSFAFEDDWLKWKIDLSNCVFIIADNRLDLIDPFLISRSQIINISILPYQKRVELVTKTLNKMLGGDRRTKKYADQITDEFCKYIITEEWGLRQTLANINNLFLSLRASVLMNKEIQDINIIQEVDKNDLSYTLTYQEGQKIILVRNRTEEKGADGIIHNVLTDLPDWPNATPHDEKKEREKITSLDLSDQGLYRFNFELYPKLQILYIPNNNLNFGVDLSKNTNLKFLDISNNKDLDISEIIFGDNKKNIEQLNFINIDSEGQIIDLRQFSKLKEITFDYKPDFIHLNKSLENKVKILYPPWQRMSEDEKLEYYYRHPNINLTYEQAMKEKIVYLE